MNYNLFSKHGPTLYGVEPPQFFLLNLLLNFNLVVVLAIISLPLVLISNVFIENTKTRTSLLINRLLPFYLWFGILSSQEHKEERFGFPAYGLLCFNGAVSLYFIRLWFELAYKKISKKVISNKVRLLL